MTTFETPRSQTRSPAPLSHSKAEPHHSWLKWLAGALLLGLLAWQGHHVAHWVPRFEAWIEQLGPWGPIAFFLAVFLLEPLLVPDSIFGAAAGAAFGLVAGTAYYVAAVYVSSLTIHLVSRRWLRRPVLVALGSRPRLRALALETPRRGPHFTLLLRLVPLNPAVVSYALGAVQVPLRYAAVGNFGMLPHMIPTVYFGAAAVHLTRMAGAGHAEWEIQGVALVLGLAACVALSAVISRSVWAKIESNDGSAP